MSTVEKPAELETPDVRYLLNQWGAGSFFRVKRLGDRIAILEVNPRSSYKILLQSQYEDRTTSRGSDPYQGGTIDEHGQPPAPWSIAVDRPTSFQERTVQIRVPHTETVQTCPHCQGGGTTRCPHCSGSGRVNCTWCNGTGFRNRTETRMETDVQGNQVQRMVTVQDPCTCFMGKVNCSGCQGSGSITCSGCAGNGRVRTFDLLTVHFHCDTLHDVVHSTKVPNALLQQSAGQVLVDQQTEQVTSCGEVPPEIRERGQALLDKSRPTDPSQSHLLFQHLHIEQVPIQEVVYTFRNSGHKQLWIYGNDQRIYAPGAPKPWIRLAGLIIGGIVGVALLIFLLTLLF